jgi:putative aminopeptidase FrvX
MKTASKTATVLLFGFLAFAQTRDFKFSLVDKSIVLKRIEEVPAKNEQRAAKIKELFSEVGCSQELSEQPVKHSRFSNILCRLPGDTDEVVIVGAHYDQISPAQGIMDNWSGASLLASLYQSLASRKRRHTFLFVSFCEEEHGLIGSAFFAGQMTKEQVAKTEAMVNLDTLGLSPTKVWISAADKDLIKYLAIAAESLKLPVHRMDTDGVGTSDSESFASKHIPRITIHSITQKTLGILHSRADTIKQLRPDDYYDTYHLIAGYLAYLDEVLQPRTGHK